MQAKGTGQEQGIGGRWAAKLLAAAALAAAGFVTDAPAAAAQVITEDCFTCRSCSFNGEPGHRVTDIRVAPGALGLTNSEVGPCGPGPCSAPQDDHHEVCRRPPASSSFSVAALANAVEAGDMDQIAALVEAGGSAVEVNRERNALQVVGCTGAIVAHIPLPEEQVTQLAAL